ncbi:hypothetical protein T4B_6831 [Trichinella pseudospiralis]|uniref:Uncharacterized protein n=2 Tax=Trichinella pseudospiralis TaxID=6337 RepID=A0A0V1GRH8_TRIPS|nr:hypothetical protein T4B_6831 [Trichinella pseudospiralis]
MFFNQCVKKPCHELLQSLWEKESFTFLDCYHLCEFPRVAFGNCKVKSCDLNYVDAELFNISLACEDEMKVSLSWSEFKSNFQMVTTVNMEVPALCHL